MEPATKKIRANVPINSATSFCEMLYMENSLQDEKEDVPDSNGCILAAMWRRTPALGEVDSRRSTADSKEARRMEIAKGKMGNRDRRIETRNSKSRKWPRSGWEAE